MVPVIASVVAKRSTAAERGGDTPVANPVAESAGRGLTNAIANPNAIEADRPGVRQERPWSSQAA